MIANQSPDTVLVLYYVTPAITAEGDEDSPAMLKYIKEAFSAGQVRYVGFTFPETPEHIDQSVFVVVNDVTRLWFTVPLNVVLPFHDEEEFTPGIKKALSKNGALVKSMDFYDKDVALSRIDVTVKKVID